MPRSGRQVLIGSVAVLALGAAALLLLVFGGIVNVAATVEHSAPVRWILRTTLERSVRVRARDIQVPAGIRLQDRALAERAFDQYSEMCALCHGAPGVEAASWMVLNPEPPRLVEVASRWSDAELYWIIKNGIRMTGMPASGPTHGDEELWAIAAFVRQLPAMTPEQYQGMARRRQATRPSDHHHHHGR